MNSFKSLSRVTSQPPATPGEPETSTPTFQNPTRAVLTVSQTVRRWPILWPTLLQTLESVILGIWILLISANSLLRLIPTNSIDGCQGCCLNILSPILRTWRGRPTRERPILVKWLTESCLRRSPQTTASPMMPLLMTLLYSTSTTETQRFLVTLRCLFFMNIC